jgi:broad specificity phosphatase PhoE
MAGHGVALEVEPLLDDVDVGALEGQTVDEYRAWKREHTRDDAFPEGESLNDAARRYAAAYRKLAGGEGTCMLVVCHEIPIRYALNAIQDSKELDGPVHEIPNAVPFLFEGDALARAADRVEELSRVLT